MDNTIQGVTQEAIGQAAGIVHHKMSRNALIRAYYDDLHKICFKSHVLVRKDGPGHNLTNDSEFIDTVGHKNVPYQESNISITIFRSGMVKTWGCTKQKHFMHTKRYRTTIHPVPSRFQKFLNWLGFGGNPYTISFREFPNNHGKPIGGVYNADERRVIAQQLKQARIEIVTDYRGHAWQYG